MKIIVKSLMVGPKGDLFIPNSKLTFRGKLGIHKREHQNMIMLIFNYW